MTTRSTQQYKFENVGRNPITIEVAAENSDAQPHTFQWGLPGDLRQDKSPAHVVTLTAEEYERAKKSKAFCAMIDPQQPAHYVLRQMVV